jgi:nucleotide-binding universal stress UspA family protein
MFKQILVPVDGGDLMESTVKRACSFAKESDASLTFYHAKPTYFPPVMAGEGVIVDVGANDAFRAAMSKQAENILASAAQLANEYGVKFVSTSSECDSPYEGIIAAAQNSQCDLIFMSSHGRRGVRALLLGSETQKVLTHCNIPVLVFR